MSPASKSKSETSRAVKEQSKASLKSSSVPASSGNGIPGSAYNPVSGTFHTLETAPPAAPSPTPQNNGRFRTIDETEEHHSGSSLGTAPDFDSLSNNDSCSGESEDQKEKAATNTTPRMEPIPGSDSDKRERIRQKNERKHQRQRERRTQELHERCTGYLMSRKLEALSQKLAVMGFGSERATMALILNEGHVEESVAWLLESSEESKQQGAANLDGVNLKIDIADELAQITALEIKFKCTKQEVERVVVACEGDLGRADGALKAQKQEVAGVPPRLERSVDPVTSAVEFSNKLPTFAQSPAGRTQAKAVAPISIQQLRRDERDFNYTKPVVTEKVQVELMNRNLQSRSDWVKPQAAATLDKRWPSTSSSPSVPYHLASPLQVAVPQGNSEAQYLMGRGHEMKTSLQVGASKEPVIVIQRPQSNGAKQNIPSTSISLSTSPPASAGWYPNGAANIDMLKVAAANGVLGHHQLLDSRFLGSNSQQFHPRNTYQPIVSSPMEARAAGWGGSWSSTGASTWTPSSSLDVASSLGLFAGRASGSSRSSSPVDWSTGGSMPQCDFTNIDWSLDPMPVNPPTLRSHQLYGATFAGGRPARPAVNGDVRSVVGLQDGSLMAEPPSAVGSYEWTSPFNGRDLFRAHRRFPTSPGKMR